MSKPLFSFVHTSVYPSVLKISQIPEFISGKWKEMVIPVRQRATSLSLLSKLARQLYAPNASNTLIFSPARAHFCVHLTLTALNALANIMGFSAPNSASKKQNYDTTNHHGSGGPMSSTQNEILKLKSQISILQKQIAINVGDKIEVQRLRKMIEARKKLLETLGAV